MHLLFADRLPEQTIADLEARGHVCVMEPGLAADDLAGRIAGFDGLVVRSTKVKRAVFEAADRLVLVIRAGAGTNTIDTDAAASHGVFVCNVPGRNAAAVAELTMGLLLAIDRRIADNVAGPPRRPLGQAALQQGRGAARVDHGHHRPRLDRLRASPSGRRRSASSVQALAKPGRSAHAVGRGPRSWASRCATRWRSWCPPPTSSPSTSRPTRTPSTSSTTDFLARMKKGAILLNTSRGDVVDEARAARRRWTPARYGPAWTCSPTNPARGKGAWDSPLARHPERRRDPPHRRVDASRRSAPSRRA